VAAVPWNPWVGLGFMVAVFYVSQILAGLLLSIYPTVHHWDQAQANLWLAGSVAAQFIFLVMVEALVLTAIYFFLRAYQTDFRLIGLKRPRWRDVGWALLLTPIYYILFLIMVAVVSHSVHGFNPQQQQVIGFQGVHGRLDLLMTFASLVILPPLTEEIMVRGFLYSSLKKGLPVLYAVLLTSVLFALPHLAEGGATGPLWIAALDTFILSLFLIYLREKTSSLWGPITLHAIKNGIAFLALFVLH